MCDTNGGSMPEEVAALTKEAAAAVDVPLGIHTHNDCELAVANSLAAVDAGAVHVQGTINGLGERCGNADLVSVVANLALKKQGYEVLGGDGVRASHRAVALRLRSRQHELPQRTSRSSAPARSPTRAACTSTPSNRAAQQLRAHRARAGRQRAPRAGERAVRPVEHRRPHRRRTTCSTTSELMEQSAAAKSSSMENRGYQFEAAEASFDLLGAAGRRHVPAALRAAALPRQRRDQSATAARSPRRPSSSASATKCGTKWPRATAP